MEVDVKYIYAIICALGVLLVVPPVNMFTVRLFSEPCNVTSFPAAGSTSGYNLQTMDPAKVIQSSGAIGGIVIDNNFGSTIDTGTMNMFVGPNISIPMVFMFHKEGLELLDSYSRDNNTEVILSDGSDSTSHGYVFVQLMSSPYYGTTWYKACLLASDDITMPFEPVRGYLEIANDNRACSSVFLNYGKLKGKIVIVQEGDCSFDEKVGHLNNTGVTAGIVIDDVTGTTNTVFSRTIIGPVWFPIVLLLGTDARNLLTEYNTNPDLQIVIVQTLLNSNTTTTPTTLTVKLSTETDSLSDTTDSTKTYSNAQMTTTQSKGWTNISIQAIVDELTINKKTTNKNYRRYHTAPDTRQTSRAIGAGFILPIISVYITILVVDIPRMVVDFRGNPGE